jgi:hypothetical protein
MIAYMFMRLLRISFTVYQRHADLLFFRTFLKRKVPYKSLIKHHLTAASELKSARLEANQVHQA